MHANAGLGVICDTANRQTAPSVACATTVTLVSPPSLPKPSRCRSSALCITCGLGTMWPMVSSKSRACLLARAGHLSFERWPICNCRILAPCLSQCLPLGSRETRCEARPPICCCLMVMICGWIEIIEILQLDCMPSQYYCCSLCSSEYTLARCAQNLVVCTYLLSLKDTSVNTATTECKA